MYDKGNTTILSDMQQEQTKEMCWMDRELPTGTTRKTLHLKVNGDWLPYFATQYAVPRHLIPGEGSGFATYSVLFKQGWELVPDPQQLPDPG